MIKVIWVTSLCLLALSFYFALRRNLIFTVLSAIGGLLGAIFIIILIYGGPIYL